MINYFAIYVRGYVGFIYPCLLTLTISIILGIMISVFKMGEQTLKTLKVANQQ